MNNDKEFETHNISISCRKKSEFTGIDDVLFFDDNTVSVHSAMGDLMIEGEELKIENFSIDRRILQINGKINGVYYLENSDKKRHSKKRTTKQQG